ncbi:glucosidase II beta subunit-like-domain-containing protein [Syncephalastrum racemosum]|uniref:Glucosidase II beta subunit-like-domain-containing protein n=1 Tax=Syncephalastrum racemosum TaxID=13706 RepID=A0A1X2HW74_SYNRA|nr:glucosidase II beta subunit-like-domain-containing protein [Syncephalastrum racemosum]
MLLKAPFILAAVTLVLGSEDIFQAVTRGVAPEQHSLYASNKFKSSGQWTCLDGSKTIPYAAVNDDYCDCPDGSDEPGTSACPNGRFYCENKGHIPAYIKSWSVNDGVCDEACCDGSDETSGLAVCPDRCAEVAAVYAKEQAALHLIQSEGAAAKQKLIDEAEKTVTEWQEEKARLEDALAIKRAELMRRQSEVDSLEKEVKGVRKTSKKKCPPCNSRRTDLVTLRDHVESLQSELDELVSILSVMKRDHNHNFHDMAVKAAIVGYDEFMTTYEDTKKEVNDDLARLDIPDSDDDASSDDSETEEDEEEEVIDEESGEGQALLEKIESSLPSAVKSWLPFNKEKSPTKDAGTISKKQMTLQAARQARNDVEEEIRQDEQRLNTINDDLNKDYGAQHEWLKLKDVCIEKDAGE